MKTILVYANILCVFQYKGLNGVYHFFLERINENCNCVISSSASYEAMTNSAMWIISLRRIERGC